MEHVGLSSLDDVSPTSRERELQVMLQEKEAELEERGRLLFKTKVAIEQLQQELIASKREVEGLRERAQKSQEEARNMQLQLQKQEEELAAREEEAAANDQDAKHYAAESQEFQARLADAEEDKAELQGRAEALAQRLKEAELAATSARSEAQRSQERASALDEDLHATEATLAAVQEQLSHALQEQEDNEQVVREVVRKNKALQEEFSATCQALDDTRGALEQAQRQVAALESTLAGERSKAVADQHTAEAELMHAQREAKQRAAEYETRLATLREQMDRERHGAEVAEKQAKAAHHKKLEELRQQHASEKDTAEAAWAVAKAETQQQWLSALHNLQQKGADQLASQLATSTQEATKAAAAYHAKLEAAEVKLEEAHKRFEAHKNALHQRLVDADAQRVALEGTWQRRLLESEQGQASLKAEVHAKLLIVSERLEGLISREARHASRRSQLVKAVDALHRAGQEEGARHRQAEAAMQEAVALFKAELAEKSARLAALQADLKQLKDWQVQSISCLQRGMVCPPSPERLRPSPAARHRPRPHSSHTCAYPSDAGKAQCPIPLHENRATTNAAGFTVWASPAKRRHSRNRRPAAPPHSAPHTPFPCHWPQDPTSSDVASPPESRGKDDPKQMQRWCQTLTNELGTAMHRLQESLSPERPRHNY